MSATESGDGRRPDDRGRCQAIATATGEQCRRRPMDAVPYCPDHAHLFDPDLDETR